MKKIKILICVAFYPDNNETLKRLVNDYIKIKNISLSQMNINFIVNKCNGNREFLYNELEKIENLSKNGKKISPLKIWSKLINLIRKF